MEPSELTQNEQLFLELVNRARLDPAAEAARYDIGLNDGIFDDELTADAKQPLAHNPLLGLAAERHSDDMLDRDYFDTEAPDTSESEAPFGVFMEDRIVNAGYTPNDPQAVGENLDIYQQTDVDLTFAVNLQYERIFETAEYRENTLDDSFRETGIAQQTGLYPSPVNGVDNDTSMLTQKFATSGTDIFLTGVAYTDENDDDFYSIGEAEEGVEISVAGTQVQTASAGGYAMALDGDTTTAELSYTWDGETRTASVDMAGRNVKVDLVGGDRLLSSGDLTLGDGIAEGGLLGVDDLALTGNALDNLLIAGRGDNALAGGGGVDIAQFSGSRTDYDISDEDGTITVTDTREEEGLNQGANTLSEIATLRFSDGDFGIDDLLDTPLDPGDGPRSLAGQLRDTAGNDLEGASVTFTPDGDLTPGLGAQTGADGRFALGLEDGESGRLDAELSYGTGDPAITAGDALDVLRIAVGLEPSFGPAQTQNFIAADINGDNRVTAGDALEVLRSAVGLESDNAPKWAFFDEDTDWDAAEADRNNVDVDTGIDIASLGADQEIDMTGILLGNMDSV